ncbi:MAG: Na(+)/H(+) antiporter subunit B [Rhodospirillaceae bacterium]|jgi:multicomponent Na+:H+ antiporter subunit B|nr:Na(+)/H(+) antiporter subunit B [Rhodospirillaceae bacterium]
MRGHLILRVVSKILIPFLLMFALYVQFHGDFGPGGGFQAGVIVAAAFVLYALIFGLRAMQKIISPALLEIAVPLGVLIYAGVGVYTWILGGNFLDYNMLDSHDPSHGQHLGVLLVEAGVLLTVSSTMLLIFYTFAGRGR